MNVGWVPGVSTIQALGRGAVDVLAVDHRPGALGFRSRYARPVVVPDHHTDEEGFVAALVRLGDSLAAPAPIFAVDDEDLAALARNRDRLGDRFLYPWPTAGDAVMVTPIVIPTATSAITRPRGMRLLMCPPCRVK